MKILFTKGHSAFSSLIQHVTGEEISHVVIQVGRFVIQSNLRGLTLDTLEHFNKTATTVYTIDLLNVSEYKALQIYNNHAFRPYDFLSFFLLGLRSLKLPFLPKADLRGITGMYICTEFVSEVALDEELLITPKQLYLKLLKG